jgi:2-aminoethylphosphonate-pyruvate transaminase
LPPFVTYTMLHDALKAEGFVIYAGQSHLTSSLFRISTMGDVSSGDIDRLLRCVARFIE